MLKGFVRGRIFINSPGLFLPVTCNHHLLDIFSTCILLSEQLILHLNMSQKENCIKFSFFIFNIFEDGRYSTNNIVFEALIKDEIWPL